MMLYWHCQYFKNKDKQNVASDVIMIFQNSFGNVCNLMILPGSSRLHLYK